MNRISTFFISKRKLYILCLICFFIGAATFGQVGIGNTSPNAQLDISATNVATPTNTDGILIPRVDEFPIATPTAAQDGMMIFATGSGAPSKGFYYWDQSIPNWVGIGGVSNDHDWYEEGTSLPPTSNAADIFTEGDVGIGTNTPSARLHIDGGTIPFRVDVSGTTALELNNRTLVFQNSGRSVFIGTGAGVVDDLTNNNNTFVGQRAGNNNVDGYNNTFIGYRAGRDNVDGFNNTAIGRESLLNNTSGIINLALGSSALIANTSGNANTALGTGALQSSTNTDGDLAVGYLALSSKITGVGNVSVGYRSGSNDEDSQRNTYIGYEAGSGSGTGMPIENKTGNIFIGYQSGYSESGSERLYIENSNSGTPLIYGEFDNDILRVNGSFQINDPGSSGYSFPPNDGTANQSLTTDGSGNLSWITPTTASPSIVRVTLSVNQPLASGPQKLLFDTVVFDTNSEFDTANNRFVATSTGYYQINAGYYANGTGVLNLKSIMMYINGVLYQDTTTAESYPAIYKTLTGIVSLAANDTVEIYASIPTATFNVSNSATRTFFEIKRID